MTEPLAKSTELKGRLLAAAVSITGGDLDKEFSFEELLVAAWQADHAAFGLRGFERKYPDSERLHRELDSRGGDAKGLVDRGDFQKVRARVYRLTPKGLVVASRGLSVDGPQRERVDRQMEAEVRRILEHQLFVEALRQPDKPVSFRQAARFWGVAPGTPPRAARERVAKVEETLQAALLLLETRGVDNLSEGRGRLLFDRQDVLRCLEFHRALTTRFAKELMQLTA